jgi:hypothetical protein
VKRCDSAQQMILPVPRLSWQSRMKRHTSRGRWFTIGQWDDSCVIEPTSYTAACANETSEPRSLPAWTRVSV